MKVLLVEDDEDKREQLREFLSSELSAEVTEARSRQSGIHALLKDSFDLIVLDMSMPTFDITPTEDGGRPQAYAGRDILHQMDRYAITTKVVVVTQFDRFGQSEDEITLLELDKQLEGAFPDNYLGAVYYNVSYAGWQESLRTLLVNANFLNS
jgi:CheY-like chemotaxis protein